MDIATLTRYLEDKQTVRCEWSTSFVNTTYETMPSEFIGFAEMDLQSTFDHKYINALSNAKRALDCQADRLLKLFGFSDKKLGFPDKIKIIQKFEIVAPSILNKINKIRNLMEHQYIKPEAEEVEDFLGIVSLFISYTEPYASSFLDCVDYRNDTNPDFDDFGEVSITVDNIMSLLRVSTTNLKTDTKISLEINKSDPYYIEVFKLHLKKMEYR